MKPYTAIVGALIILMITSHELVINFAIIRMKQAIYDRVRQIREFV